VTLEIVSGAAGQAPGGPDILTWVRTAAHFDGAVDCATQSCRGPVRSSSRRNFLEPLWNLFECPVSGAKKMKKNQEVKSMACVVPQEGFEPPTPSLRMMCSTD
jgi:hypothetical protein